MPRTRERGRAVEKDARRLNIALLASLFLVASCHLGGGAGGEKRAAFRDPKLPVEARVADLIGRMTLDEKISQLSFDSPAIERLGIPAYNWWNECLHGVARAGRATVFPQAIGLAATFDENLMYQVSNAISDEARAMYQAAVDKDRRFRYGGLTFWTPNINIFRDPRWGRGQETYGEDPNLTSVMGTAFVRGLQGDDPRYLKVAACAKHYVVHSGPEGERHVFNAEVGPKDLYETYLPAFKALVTDARVEAVMCAYNRTDGEACCGSKTLLGKILRQEWGFQGYIVSDCGAVTDLYQGHKVVKDGVEAAALAINSGVNLECGDTFANLIKAVNQGFVTDDTINKSLAILLRTRFRLGMFDPPKLNPYARIPVSVIHSPEHQALARKAAAESVVLLKNRQVLPLSRDMRRLFVTGPSAADVDVLLGNYHGVSENLTTILEGITGKLQPGSFVDYKPGFFFDRPNASPIDRAGNYAKAADATVVVMGLSSLIEGEEGDAIASPTQGDRSSIELPANQIEYLRNLRKDNSKPIIVVLTGGSPVAIPEVTALADAILYVWYPGEQGGQAVADVLFGDAVPSGRLPVTFPQSTSQLPPFENYSMAGRTYRYMTEEPLFPFGFGLSYTRFAYRDLTFDVDKIHSGDSIHATVMVKNVGEQAGEEVVQLYVSDVVASVRTPATAMKAFRRITLAPNEERFVTFTITPAMMTLVDDAGNSRIEPGQFKVTVGGCSPSQRGESLGAAKPVQATFVVE
jgi:beta-glucosidase